MQQEQAEHLRGLVEQSQVLTPEEKADWLDMLILMNDKQAAELEQILKTQQPIAQIAQTVTRAPTVPNGGVPPLSHISNLPMGINPVPTKPVPLPWQKQFDATMEEKELPAPPRPVPAPKPAVPKPVPPAQTARPTPEQSPRPQPQFSPATAPTAHRASRKGIVHLENLEDVGQLTLAAMRSMDMTDLLIRLQQLAKLEGYFNLLSYLEDSALYKSYIETGKRMLSGTMRSDQSGQPDPNILTKPEFESFADILRKIQIN